MLTRLKKVFRPEVNAHEGTKIVVNREKLETRVALLEDGSLEEYNIEREDDENIVGSIFKGRVKNIEPGLKAMFVDIGFEKNAFLLANRGYSLPNSALMASMHPCAPMMF